MTAPEPSERTVGGPPQAAAPQSTYGERPVPAAGERGVAGTGTASGAAYPLPTYNPARGASVEGSPAGGAPPGGTLPPAGAARSTGPAASYPAAPQKRNLKPLLIAGGVVLVLGLVCLVAGGLALFNQFFPGGNTASLLASPSNTPPGIAGLFEGAPATQSPGLIPAPTETQAPPTQSPTIPWTSPPSSTQTETVPPGPYARITDISIDSQNHYVVEYETFEFTEVISSTTLHVHFFYDTVTPDEAGVPGSGPWILYGGPRPFTGYTTDSRPQGSAQMCILVANPDHSVKPDTGNCMILPDY